MRCYPTLKQTLSWFRIRIVVINHASLRRILAEAKEGATPLRLVAGTGFEPMTS